MSRINPVALHFLDFALVLLSMFFFYVEAVVCTCRVLSAFVVRTCRSFFMFVHSPPITHVHRFVATAAQLVRPPQEIH
jgi:hypothetical protein